MARSDVIQQNIVIYDISIGMLMFTFNQSTYFYGLSRCYQLKIMGTTGQFWCQRVCSYHLLSAYVVLMIAYSCTCTRTGTGSHNHVYIFCHELMSNRWSCCVSSVVPWHSSAEQQSLNNIDVWSKKVTKIRNITTGMDVPNLLHNTQASGSTKTINRWRHAYVIESSTTADTG